MKTASPKSVSDVAAFVTSLIRLPDAALHLRETWSRRMAMVTAPSLPESAVFSLRVARVSSAQRHGSPRRSSGISIRSILRGEGRRRSRD